MKSKNKYTPMDSTNQQALPHGEISIHTETQSPHLVRCKQPNNRKVVWFSCGAASACVLKIASQKYSSEELEAVYCDTSCAEHPDNKRFMAEVEKWAGVPIQTIKSAKYKTVEEVWEKKKYMAGILGAPCTVEMKKVPRFAYQRPDDLHLFGMTVDEKKRAASFQEDNHELNLKWLLIEAGMTKADCMEMIKSAGIELPSMYKLGFKNNNCIGCVKATSPKYWNDVREFFPEVFEKRMLQSRRLGARLARVKGKRVFLDELEKDNREVVIEDISCGPQCSSGIRADDDVEM